MEALSVGGDGQIHRPLMACGTQNWSMPGVSVPFHIAATKCLTKRTRERKKLFEFMVRRRGGIPSSFIWVVVAATWIVHTVAGRLRSRELWPSTPTSGEPLL